MIINNNTPEAKRALRVVLSSGVEVRSIVSFNTATRIATVVIGGKMQEELVERFCFVSGNNIKRVLPKCLHDHVMTVY